MSGHSYGWVRATAARAVPIALVMSIAVSPVAAAQPDQAPGVTAQMESLSRGLVSIRTGNANHVSWRMLG